jgi:hypothetical protein
MLTTIFTSLVMFSATQGVYWASSSGGGSAESSGRYCRGRLGTYTALARQPIIRVDVPDDRPQHRLLCVLHRLPRAQQRRLLVRAPAFALLTALTCFSARWGIPVLTLRAYLQFWAVVCAGVSLFLFVGVHEPPEALDAAELNTRAVYEQIVAICRLPHVQVLLAVHVVAKIGFQANDAVTSLKLVERGLGREDLAIAVLVDFPFQIVGGWLAARWSTPARPLRPWVWAYAPRLAFAGVSALIVRWFPAPPISQGFFVFLIIHTVLQSFSS